MYLDSISLQSLIQGIQCINQSNYIWSCKTKNVKSKDIYVDFVVLQR